MRVGEDWEEEETDTDVQDRGELWVFGKQKQEGGEEKGWDTDTHTEINEQCGDDRINLWDFPDTNALFF